MENKFGKMINLKLLIYIAALLLIIAWLLGYLCFACNNYIHLLLSMAIILLTVNIVFIRRVQKLNKNL